MDSPVKDPAPGVMHISARKLWINGAAIHFFLSEKCMAAAVRSPALGAMHNFERKNWVAEEDWCMKLVKLCMAAPE